MELRWLERAISFVVVPDLSRCAPRPPCDQALWLGRDPTRALGIKDHSLSDGEGAAWSPDFDGFCAVPGTIRLTLKSIEKFSFGHHGSRSLLTGADTRLQERRLDQALLVIAAVV